MRPVSVVLSSLFLFACGTDFAGSYSGPVTATTSCSDGSGDDRTEVVTWNVEDLGGTIEVTPYGGTCGTFVADVSGSFATARQKTCPTLTKDGATANVTITGGTFSLDGNRLAVGLSSRMILSGELSGSCTSNMSGTLTR